MLLPRLSVAFASAATRRHLTAAAASVRLGRVVGLQLHQPLHQPIRQLVSASTLSRLCGGRGGGGGGGGASAGLSHDAKLSSLLDSELRYEKSSAEQQHLPQPQPPTGFAITARQGTLFTLTKQCPDDGSLLEVSFDLNGSTASPHDEDDGEMDPEAVADDDGYNEGGAGKRGRAEAAAADDHAAAAAEEADEEILSRPDVVFRVRKPGASACLAVHCSFPPVHVSRQMAAEDPDYPTFSIDTVAMETAAPGSAGSGGGGELGAYELEADMLNDDLYKQLAEMLVHRGVTRDFEHSLVQFCTAQEHQLYLHFLAEAKKFCDA